MTVLTPKNETGVNPEVIAALNDAFRHAQCTGITLPPIIPGQMVCTAGIQARGPTFLRKVLAAISVFDTFEPDNDPEGFHNFGVVEVCGDTVWFKIDMYDAQYEYGAEDPTDLSKTRRVLTILFPSDCAPGKLACSSEVEDLTFPYRVGCGSSGK